MDGSLGFMSIKPDQIGIVNPLLIIAITPLFNSLIYPCFKKCGLLTPLQRIGTGGLLIGISFVISGIVELNLEVELSIFSCAKFSTHIFSSSCLI
jgi:solute carrier family 15 oligopeptide transporter 1